VLVDFGAANGALTFQGRGWLAAIRARLPASDGTSFSV
jgi:hypothetical protein